MKPYLFILLIVFAFNSIKAQNSYVNQWESINQNISDYSQYRTSYSISKQALDSVKSYYTSPSHVDLVQVINKYDSYGNTVSEVKSIMDNTNNWLVTEIKEHKLGYNSDGTIQLDTFYKSYRVQSSMHKDRMINTYLNNQIVKSYYSSWDTLSSSWKTLAKSTKTYNASGLLTVCEWFKRNNSYSAWSPYKKEDYNYDGNNNLIQKLTSDWSNAWIPNKRRQYFYNALNKDTLLAISEWDISSAQWFDTHSQQSIYDANANLVLVLVKIKSAVPGQLRNSSKYIYTYNSSNQLVLRINQSWYADSNDWKSMSKWEYAYDSQSNRIHEVYYIINASLTSWSKNSKTEYVYDNTYSFSDLLLPNGLDYDSIRFSHKLLYRKGYAWNFSNQSWDNGAESAYYYTEKTLLALLESSIDTYLVYPNPASDYIQIDLPESMTKATLYIYDIQGKLILETNLLNSSRINVQSLKSGMYIYKVCDDVNINTGKLIVE